MKKTAKEWFEQLPEPIRTQAIANSKRHEEDYSSLSDCLDCNFNWQQSTQGLEYWYDISNRSYKGEFDQPTPNLNGWIPVSERLPTANDADENGDVLILGRKNLNGVCYFDAVRVLPLITHWQPLPKLPEVKL